VNEIQRIVDQLAREHAGEPWHGAPLTEILSGVDHLQAAARPIAGAHTIWELVLHVTAWKNETRHRLTGGRAGEPRDGNWPIIGEVTAERWREAREKLDLAHQLLVSAVKEFKEEDLPVPTNDPRSEAIAPTYYELLMGLLQHDVYHAGQIALLKRAIGLTV
jgi:uncharacterized damage-inducible protein DinB